MAELTVKDVALRLGENEILKGVSVGIPAGQRSQTEAFFNQPQN